MLPDASEVSAGQSLFVSVQHIAATTGTLKRAWGRGGGGIRHPDPLHAIILGLYLGAIWCNGTVRGVSTQLYTDYTSDMRRSMSHAALLLYATVRYCMAREAVHTRSCTLLNR